MGRRRGASRKRKGQTGEVVRFAFVRVSRRCQQSRPRPAAAAAGGRRCRGGGGVVTASVAFGIVPVFESWHSLC